MIKLALIKCPECKKQVSDMSPSCPSCGHPIKAMTIEKTGKKWKGLKLLSVGLIVLGIVLGLNNYPTAGGILGVIGFWMLPVAFIGAWWHHG